jgi:hypothetical protein
MRALRFVSLVLIVLILWSGMTSMYLSPVRADTIYNARSSVNVQWSTNETEKPIVPRSEIKRLGLTITFQVDTGESIGQGLYDGWKDSALAFIDLEVVDSPSWCSAVISPSTVATNLTRYSQTSADLYLILDESAPAYGEGYLSIKAKSRPLNLIQGFEDTFNLNFVPSYLPVISVTLPDSNSKRASPMETVVFPITIENIGNARESVFFNVDWSNKDWVASITDEVDISETGGSTGTAYLTIIPPKDFGYHYGEEVFTVTIIPTRAENTSERGAPLYATFIVQNRGFSIAGIEGTLPIGLIILVILIGIFLLFRHKLEDYVATWKSKERKPGITTQKRQPTTAKPVEGKERNLLKTLKQPFMRLKTLHLPSGKEEKKQEEKEAPKEKAKIRWGGLSKAFTSSRKETPETREAQPQPTEKRPLFRKAPAQEKQPTTVIPKKTEDVRDKHPERNKALLKIKRQQEKQRKKFMKSTG